MVRPNGDQQRDGHRHGAAHEQNPLLRAQRGAEQWLPVAQVALQRPGNRSTAINATPQ